MGVRVYVCRGDMGVSMQLCLCVLRVYGCVFCVFMDVCSACVWVCVLRVYGCVFYVCIGVCVLRVYVYVYGWVCMCVHGYRSVRLLLCVRVCVHVMCLSRTFRSFRSNSTYCPKPTKSSDLGVAVGMDGGNGNEGA